MDKLYLLFAGITLVFVLSVLAMNMSGFYYTNKQELSGFQNLIMSDNEKKIRACMDSLALYTTPGGSPTEEGKHLCEIFKGVRAAMMEKEERDDVKDKTIASKNVENKLANKIPGGALPCPLFTYPVGGSDDKAWLAWFQKIPVDFGARIVFMVIYADENITPQKQASQDAIKDNLAGFEDICTPELIEMKTRNQKANSCVMPSDIKPEQVNKTVDEIIKQLISTRDTILKNTISPIALKLDPTSSSPMKNKIRPDVLGNPDKLFAEMKMRIARTKDSLDFLNKEKDKANLLANSVLSSTSSS